MTTIIRHAIFTLIFSLAIFATPQNLSAFADPGGEADPGQDPDIPIDGGVGILVAAGIGYGIKKYRDHRKNIPPNKS